MPIHTSQIGDLGDMRGVFGLPELILGQSSECGGDRLVERLMGRLAGLGQQTDLGDGLVGLLELLGQDRVVPEQALAAAPGVG